ncbi:hypothetical protein SORBI_3001G496100 [Sorghum bicolor]|uniref:Uncharacterized protein n=1 Tax=Sorghum bicolor TaxID=4558 RepID=A0A1B6QQD4_SORBI|nr:hypothetical protein SORBI_3001G496100 [Sorghum bicolor]
MFKVEALSLGPVVLDVPSGKGMQFVYTSNILGDITTVLKRILKTLISCTQRGVQPITDYSNELSKCIKECWRKCMQVCN